MRELLAKELNLLKAVAVLRLSTGNSGVRVLFSPFLYSSTFLYDSSYPNTSELSVAIGQSHGEMMHEE